MSMSDDLQYRLFFNTHYKVVVKQSLRPIWSSSGMYFPSSTVIVKKPMSILDKILYYIEDIKLWLRTRGQ